MSGQYPAGMTGNALADVDRMFREHLALAVLRLLGGNVLRGAGNDQLLQELASALGFRVSNASLRDVLGFLERAGAITSNAVDRLLVVELRRLGREIADGLVDLEGVARPGPDCPY